MDKLIEIKLDIKIISFIFALSKTNIKNMNSDKLYKLYLLVKFNLNTVELIENLLKEAEETEESQRLYGNDAGFYYLASW